METNEIKIIKIKFRNEKKKKERDKKFRYEWKALNLRFEFEQNSYENSNVFFRREKFRKQCLYSSNLRSDGKKNKQ